MRKPFKAKKLDQIFTEQRNPWFLHELNGFICHKKWDLSQQLNDVDTTFYLIKRLGSAIVGDGWDSVFVQTYTYSELQRIIDTFRQDISLPDFADKLEAGRAIYYLGRTDLDSPDEILVNGSVFAHLTRAQRKSSMRLGMGLTKRAVSLPNLSRFWRSGVGITAMDSWSLATSYPQQRAAPGVTAESYQTYQCLAPS